MSDARVEARREPSRPSDEFTIAEAARVVGVEQSRLRYWAQIGVVGPSARRGGRPLYTFQDLVSLRAARGLFERGVSAAAIRRGLEALRDKLATPRPLAELRVVSDGAEIAVVTDEAAFRPAGGQLLLRFAVAELCERAAEIHPLAEAAQGEESAYSLFLSAAAAEDAGDARRAAVLLEQALGKDPGLAAAWTNLGRLREAEGARGLAREAYERALTLEPDLHAARHNLAGVLADTGDLERAAAEYRRVLAAAPDLLDAAYNLGCLLAETGASDEARLHLRRYLQHDGVSEWAARARELLLAMGPAAA